MSSNASAAPNLDQQQQSTAAAGTVEIGGRLLVVQQATPDQEITIRREFRRQCLPLLRSPLQAIAGDLKMVAAISPDLARLAVEAAVREQAGGEGGKGEPTDEMVANRMFAAEGCAFRLWVLARTAHPELTLADVQAMVTQDQVDNVLGQLWKALGMSGADNDRGEKKDPPPAPPATGG